MNESLPDMTLSELSLDVSVWSKEKKYNKHLVHIKHFLILVYAHQMEETQLAKLHFKIETLFI